MDDALKLRRAAKGRFTRAANSLKLCLTDGNLAVTVERRYQELRNVWKVVQDKDDEYVSIVGESEDSTQWINELCDIFCSIEIQADEYLNKLSNEIKKDHQEECIRKQKEELEGKSALEEAQRLESTQKKITEIRSRCTQEGAKITTHIENITELLSETDTTKYRYIAVALEENRHQLDSAMSTCQSAHIKLLSMITDGEDTENKWMTQLWKHYHKISSEMTIFCSKHNQKPSVNVPKSNSGIQLEKLKFQIYDGNIRRYPKFKSDFQQYIQPMCNSNQVAFVLKSYLADNIREEIETISDDINEVWKRLDKKYGDKGKLIDSIMVDIKDLVPASDDHAILHMINKVDRAHNDLQRMGLEHEINNATIISLIEGKMPEEMYREWVKVVTSRKDETTSKFPELHKLLLEWRDRLEYSLAEIRCPTTQQGNVNYGEERKNRPGSEKCWIHNFSTDHPIWRCTVFKAKSPAERLALAKLNNACLVCLNTSHQTDNCQRGFKCRVPSCNQPHHNLLHEAHSLGLVFHNKSLTGGIGYNAKTILQLQSLLGGNKYNKRRESINTLWDAGSTLSFITFKMAKQLRLQGKGTQLEIVKIGGEVQILNSQKFELYLTDENNNIVTVEVLGIERISSQINEVNLDGVTHIFKETMKARLNRPSSGYIDCLIGFQYAGFHPVRVDSKDHLLLLKNRFGYIIAGSHPSLVEKTQKLIKGGTVHLATGKVSDFYTLENLGICSYPECGSCACGKCHLGGKNMSLNEEKEYHLIKNNLTYIAEKKRWEAKLPWINDPINLPDNRCVALATLHSTEKKLYNTEQGKLYQRQVTDMIARGAARKVDENELSRYPGPTYYISHHAVMKPESKTTPCRIVFNSSAKFHGMSLNDYYAKGPSMLNELLGVLLRFREESIAFIGDISKMFHSIGITLEDQMTHLFLWREMDVSRAPETYAITAVNMGDRPSAAIAQIALQETAATFKGKYPEASETITSNSYMDDILGSVATKEEAERITKNIDEILEQGGFKIKEWIISGQIQDAHKQQYTEDQRIVKMMMNKEVKGEDAERVLGMKWNTASDKLLFSVQLTSKENNKTNQTAGPVNISKRQILSQVNRLYDPCGLVSPFIVKAKILLRELWKLKLDWDDPIPDPLKIKWYKFYNEMKEIEKLTFYRSIKPCKAIGNPSLIVFSDGSSKAYGAVAYARWKTSENTFECRLIIAKNRIAPLKIIDIVRLELCGAVISKRLRVYIERELTVKFEKVYHITDSEIIQAMINKNSYGFNTFAANRIGEIHEGTSPSEWYWVKGELNIADLISRGKSPGELNADSEWQRGPAFLQLPEREWPVSRKCDTVELPEKLKTGFVAMITASQKETLTNRINIDRFSKFVLLIHTTARIMKLYARFKSYNTDKTMEPSIIDIENAEKLWFQDAQQSLDVKKKSLVKLCPRYKDELLVVGGRTERWMSSTWNKQEFILLPYQHRLSYLIALFEHQQIGHLGVAATISKIRSRFWILNIRKMVNGLVFRCVRCRIKFKKLSLQIMSPLPTERILPSPPFSSIGIDFFGPYVIKGEVQKRTRGKGYGVLINCSTSRAVYIDVSKDYSTDSLLQVIRRFTSIRGWPKNIFSDNGTQLVSASKELCDTIKAIDFELLKRHGVNHGTNWTFSPADAPWYNGATEALVKTVKRAINTAIGEHVLSFSELQTVLFEAAQLVNQRPIGRHPSDPEEGPYLCPNDLILGRASSNAPQGPFLQRTSDKYRFDFLQSITEVFWKKWIRDVFPSLVIRPKWHVQKRNVKKGDLVVIQDSNVIRGEWKRGIVTEVHPSADGIVRRVTVSYKGSNKSNYTTVERAVQRLIILVAVDEL